MDKSESERRVSRVVQKKPVAPVVQRGGLAEGTTTKRDGQPAGGGGGGGEEEGRRRLAAATGAPPSVQRVPEPALVPSDLTLALTLAATLSMVSPFVSARPSSGCQVTG